MNRDNAKGGISIFIFTLKFDKKKALFIVVMAALLLIGIILMAGAFAKRGSHRQAANDLSTESGRADYLAGYGWQVETPALSCEDVIIPKSFAAVFDEYNSIQLAQGFDLSKYAGKEVKLYCYRVSNYEGEEDVLAQLYIYKDQVIGGDIHSSSIDGFMHGIKPGASGQ